MADNALMNTRDMADRMPAVPKVISPGGHAVLDYGVASMYLGLAAKYRDQHPAAAGLAAANGLMVLGLALMTDYPGGVFRTVSLRQHRTMDWVQAGLAAFGPALLGFAGDPEAKPFYSQAMSEVGVIAATDWDA
jgi:protein involved in temperature-dependent protein secretion